MVSARAASVGFRRYCLRARLLFMRPDFMSAIYASTSGTSRSRVSRHFAHHWRSHGSSFAPLLIDARWDARAPQTRRASPMGRAPRVTRGIVIMPLARLGHSTPEEARWRRRAGAAGGASSSASVADEAQYEVSRVAAACAEMPSSRAREMSMASSMEPRLIDAGEGASPSPAVGDDTPRRRRGLLRPPNMIFQVSRAPR